MVRWLQLSRGGGVLVLVVLIASVLATSIVLPAPARASSPALQAPSFSDDFTHDTVLNAALWQVNGPVGSAFGADNCPSCTLIPITPSFSAAGMEIAAANASFEVGTIQSMQSFAPPITVSAVVRGPVSNGHPFVFALTTSDASSGVQITGNLDPNDCSNETNCGNPATCGIPANSSIPANQCYYGIYARTASSNGNWAKTPALNRTPSMEAVYTLQISVDGSGNAQFNVSEGGQVLGQSNAQVGTGPFYIILAQSEGAPVPGHGPNQAYWTSVSLTPSAPSPSPSSSGGSLLGLSSLDWLVVVIILVALVLIILYSYRRRRGLTVRVLDSRTPSPVSGANVWADGPRNFSGSTGSDGKIAFGGAKEGDYSVKASAAGYVPSNPVTVSVKQTAEFTVRLDRVAPVSPAGADLKARAEGPSPLPPPTPTVGPPAAAPSPAAPPETEEPEGFGGERIRQIIQTFQTKGAISPETALTAEELGLSRLFVRIMKRRRGKTRVFVEINGKYYLDQNALREMK